MLTFEPIQLNRRGEYLEYYRQCLEKASDYSFVNIWSWAGKYQYEWAWADDLVWLRYRYGPLYFYGAPIGAWQRDDWQKLLAENLEPHFIMTRVPETLSRIIETQMPDIVGKNQREHWEYLYNINDLIELKGSDYAAKRKLANTFERRYAYEFRPLWIQDFPAVRTFMKGWTFLKSSPAVFGLITGLPLLPSEKLLTLKRLLFILKKPRLILSGYIRQLTAEC